MFCTGVGITTRVERKILHPFLVERLAKMFTQGVYEEILVSWISMFFCHSSSRKPDRFHNDKCFQGHTINKHSHNCVGQVV